MKRDFVQNKLSIGRSHQMLTVLDGNIRQDLAVTVRTRMGAEDVLEALYPLRLRQGKPKYIPSDNGPEFVAEAMQDWLIKVGINHWLRQYNHTRSHQALNMRPPVPETLVRRGPELRGWTATGWLAP